MENLTRQEKINKMMAARHQGIVVLEDIHDPHNAAAVWRSADAFGFGKIYIIFDKEAKFNPKKIGKETSGSANKWLDFEIFSSAEECFQKLKEQGYKIYVTVLDREAKKLEKIKVILVDTIGEVLKEALDWTGKQDILKKILSHK